MGERRWSSAVILNRRLYYYVVLCVFLCFLVFGFLFYYCLIKFGIYIAVEIFYIIFIFLVVQFLGYYFSFPSDFFFFFKSQVHKLLGRYCETVL